jgi:hypothetical protein
MADPPSKATVVNSETAVRIQTKSFRPKLKLTFKDQTNSINNKVSMLSTIYEQFFLQCSYDEKNVK